MCPYFGGTDSRYVSLSSTDDVLVHSVLHVYASAVCSKFWSDAAAELRSQKLEFRNQSSELGAKRINTFLSSQLWILFSFKNKRSFSLAITFFLCIRTNVLVFFCYFR
jgi:hypothetical protein